MANGTDHAGALQHYLPWCVDHGSTPNGARRSIRRSGTGVRFLRIPRRLPPRARHTAMGRTAGIIGQVHCGNMASRAYMNITRLPEEQFPAQDQELQERLPIEAIIEQVNGGTARARGRGPDYWLQRPPPRRLHLRGTICRGYPGGMDRRCRGVEVGATTPASEARVFLAGASTSPTEGTMEETFKDVRDRVLRRVA